MFRSGITLTLITVEAAIWSYDKKIRRPSGKGVLPVPPSHSKRGSNIHPIKRFPSDADKKYCVARAAYFFFYVSLLSLFCFFVFFSPKEEQNVILLVRMGQNSDLSSLPNHISRSN